MRTPRGVKLPPNTRLGLPIHPNAGVAEEYNTRLQKLVEEMFNSISYWIEAEYKRQQDKIIAYDATVPWWRKTLDKIPAFDASPANALLQALRRRFRQWQRVFNERAFKYAKDFARSAESSTTAATAASIKDASGLAVKFKATRAMNNVMQSIVHENVGLIRTIPEKSFAELEGIIMRYVRSGRDLHALREEIDKKFQGAKVNAKRIANDQMNKATEALSRVRMQSRGITQAMWLHTGGARNPRHSHQYDMNREIFELSEGCYDPTVKRHIQPGELIGCQCTKVPIVPSFANNKTAQATKGTNA